MNALELLTVTQEQKETGLWLSGIEGTGELKGWYRNNRIWYYKIYVNGKLNGECKWWGQNGELIFHELYMDDKGIKNLYLKEQETK